MPARPYRLTRTFWWLAAVVPPLLTLLAYSLWQVVRIEARYPPAGGFVSVEGVRLHYLADGTGFGPGGVEDEDAALPIVLLHGASTSLLDFRPTLIPALASLPGAGHAPHHTRATDVSNTILQFADNLGEGQTQSSDR